VGPNSPGLAVPGETIIGIVPQEILSAGPIGVVSRSGTLTYEAVFQLTRLGMGQSCVVGIGGDPIHGLSMVEALELFQNDPHTKGILLIGEIGGGEEHRAAEYIHKQATKPVAAYIAGLTAQAGRTMGHAGAIINNDAETAQSKIEYLKAAGVHIIPNAAVIGETVVEVVSL
jgi:succinyl-CoA synthetase alpha subunit